LSLTEPHDEFLELCAVSTSGQLAEGEQERLQEHLAICESCRETLKQYESVVDQAIPVLVVAEEASKGLDARSDRSEDHQRQAEQAFFKRLEREQRGEPKKFISTSEVSPIRRPSPFSSESAWHHVWMLYAAGILIFASISLYAYRAGIHRGTEIAKITVHQRSTQDRPSLEGQLSNAGRERQLAREQVEQRDKTIATIRQQMAQQVGDINSLETAKVRLESDLRAGDTSRRDLIQQRAELAQRLDAAMSSSQALQRRLDSLAEQSAQDAARSKALEAKVNDLNRLLDDRGVALEQKDELLAHDRDIRELMGARELYIAEVHDVARDGQTQIPFGRVFYTKGKSLIFYAYDLDRQTELRRAGTFQAWGKRGPDREQAVNLGVFYEDNAAKKRWILKCDDPKALAQIDGVFVTVEPDGGSQKPSGKSLLFAYLRADSNHP